MPRRCTICHHSRHDEIAVSLFRDGTRTTARQFQVSRSALDRHKRHLPDRIVKAQQTEVVCEATLKVKSHPAVSCAIYTRHCPDVCEAAWKSHQEQRDACKAFVASHRQHGWRALPITQEQVRSHVLCESPPAKREASHRLTIRLLVCINYRDPVFIPKSWEVRR